MRAEYIFYTSDDSFDYNGPFGTQTCYETCGHGFEIDIDTRNEEPLIETVKGWGDFSSAGQCKTLEELYEYVEKNKEFCYEDEDGLGTYEILEELQEMITAFLERDKRRAA